jgi:hypothetical protein
MKIYFSIKYLLAVFAIFALVMTFAGCCPNPDYPCDRDEVNPPDSAKKYLEISDTLKRKHEEVIKELSKMADKDLYTRLQKDSLSGREPFNSLAYKEFLKRGTKSAEALYDLMIGDTRTSFLGIIALKKMDKAIYKRLDSDFVIANIVKTLEQSKSFNSWGLPHLYWEDASKILIEQGGSAIEYLKPLLKITKPAPVWGSEESMEYKKYQYRLCDYAMALILEIKNEKFTIPVEVEKRNDIIRSLTNDQ